MHNYRNCEITNKYIVKNCPSAFNTRVDGTYCSNVKITNGKSIHCQYITDCVIKQIVELCKNKDYFVKRFPNAQFSSGVQNSELAFDILQRLDIQKAK